MFIFIAVQRLLMRGISKSCPGTLTFPRSGEDLEGCAPSSGLKDAANLGYFLLLERFLVEPPAGFQPAIPCLQDMSHSKMVQDEIIRAEALALH